MDGLAFVLDLVKASIVPILGLWGAFVTGVFLLRGKKVDAIAPKAMADVEAHKAETDERRVGVEEDKAQFERTQWLIAQLEKRMEEAKIEAREERERARIEREEMRTELRGLRSENATLTGEVRTLRQRVEQLVRYIRSKGDEPPPEI